MQLRITSTKVPYAGIDTMVIFLSESGNKELAVYLPHRCKTRGKIVTPTWSPDGVVKGRIDSALNEVVPSDCTWVQAKNHAPATHLHKLLTMLHTDAFTLNVANSAATIQVANVTQDIDKSKLLNTVKALFVSFDVDELTRELRGFNSIKTVEVKPMDDNPENSMLKDDPLQLEQATTVVNALLKKFANFDECETKVDDKGQLNVTLKDFGSISTILKEDLDSDEPFQQIQVHTVHKEVVNALSPLNPTALSEVLNAVIKHVVKKANVEWDASVTSYVDVYRIGNAKETPKGTGREASIREMTHRPEVRFKLPVTPVIFNCTTLQIDIENARVVNYNNHIELRDTQYEGDPVIGVIVDFNNPISGLDNMRAIGNKNPNLPIYILWNSEEGPVLELYVE